MNNDVFEEKGYAKIHTDQSIQLCQTLSDLVQNLPDEGWTKVIRVDGNTADYSLSPLNPHIDELRAKAKDELNHELFSYSFSRFADSEKNSDVLGWDAIKSKLASVEVKTMLFGYTGVPVSDIDMIYASRFYEGDFLATHCDKGTKSRFVIACSLSKDWDPNDGGCTYILDSDRRTVLEVINPCQGIIFVMDTFKKEIPHYVSEVTQPQDSRFANRESIIVRYS